MSSVGHFYVLSRFYPAQPAIYYLFTALNPIPMQLSLTTLLLTNNDGLETGDSSLKSI
jgi:hypothetical protein